MSKKKPTDQSEEKASNMETPIEISIITDSMLKMIQAVE